MSKTRFINIDRFREAWINSDNGPSRDYLERHKAFFNGYMAALEELERFFDDYQDIITVEVNDEHRSEERCGETGPDDGPTEDHLGYRRGPEVRQPEVQGSE